MVNSGDEYTHIQKRIRAANYLTVAQLFLQDNFLLSAPLTKKDIKPRLLGHWGTCPGINIVYANLKAFFSAQAQSTQTHSVQNHPNQTRSAQKTQGTHPTPHSAPNFTFVLGPGHGFPALQANLFLDGDLAKVDKYATRTADGIAYLCKNFSWPGGYPSHATPLTPSVICEGGELGYSLATAYGAALGHPEKTFAVLIGDGELETATALASLNLPKLITSKYHGRVLPILHLNGYKISAPTIYARKSPRELNQLLRGFGYTPITIASTAPQAFQSALRQADATFRATPSHPPFLIFQSPKGLTGPTYIQKVKIAGNYAAHQIPLPHAKTDPTQLMILQRWLESYRFQDLFDTQKGFTL